ncbi:MAG: hypothetical protein IJN82_04645, partial [Clostridia bacterium]|nr:hypothetical protein [Clostridia bacterium]
TCEYLKNDAVADYYWGKQFTAVDCEFDDDGKGGKMRIILPQKGLDAHSLLKESELQSFITSETWAQTKRAVVHQRIPKFDIDQNQDLTPALKSLGVRKIFSSTDSLKPLFGNKKATIDKLEQTARVLIDEEGCKAAAYTQNLKYSDNFAPEEVDFVVDRPFIFVLYSEHNLPLFVGVVSQV